MKEHRFEEENERRCRHQIFEYISIRARNCKPFKELRNRFPAWRAGPTILFDVPARQATLASGIDSLESIPGLHKRLQIRTLAVMLVDHPPFFP